MQEKNSTNADYISEKETNFEHTTLKKEKNLVCLLKTSIAFSINEF